MQRFNDPAQANHVTSGNSATPYRDELFGPDFANGVFISEPVHNLVHHEVLEPAGVTPGRIMEIPLTEAIVEMAAAGAGVAFMACWAVSPHLASKKLVGRSLGNPGYRRSWYTVTLRNQRKPPYMTEFLNLLTVNGSKYMEQWLVSKAKA